MIESGVKYEYEPDVPNCRMICGIFITKIQDFIRRAIREMLDNENYEKHVKGMFDEFAISTVEEVILKEIGPLEEKDNVALIMSDDDVKVKLREAMGKYEFEEKEMIERDAWHIKNYMLDEFFNYLIKHKLIITNKNYDRIKKALSDKFIRVENYARATRKLLNVKFYLPEDFTPRIERPIKKGIDIVFKNIVKNINIEVSRQNEETDICSKIVIERPKKEIQISRNEENKAIVVITVEKKFDETNEKIDKMVKELGNSRREELNIVIIPDGKKHKDEEIVKFPTVELDENRKLKLVTDEDSSDFQKVFEDDPIIIIPSNEDVEKLDQTEEELIEEKTHDVVIEEDDHMLGGDFALKAILKNLPTETGCSKFQENKNILEEFFKTNVDRRLS
jgi:hypothetical protein